MPEDKGYYGGKGSDIFQYLIPGRKFVRLPRLKFSLYCSYCARVTVVTPVLSDLSRIIFQLRQRIIDFLPPARAMGMAWLLAFFSVFFPF